jgi:hypothetical protein
MNGIETVYRGIRFRSRAEARWAAFFDLMRWTWHYEPVDLEGYIPDFILDFADSTIFEVKGGALSLEDLEDHQAKLEMTSWSGEAVLVGAHPLWGDHDGINPTLGLIGERISDAYDWAPCRVHRCAICCRVSVHHEHGSWRCRVCGCHDGNRYIGGIEASELNLAWAEACNMTQWNASGRGGLDLQPTGTYR